MLSLQPQFDGTAIHQKMSSLTTELHQLHSEANSTIQNAISHRVKFAEERVAIVDDWLLRVRALIESWVKGEEECTAEIKEVSATLTLLSGSYMILNTCMETYSLVSFTHVLVCQQYVQLNSANYCSL